MPYIKQEERTTDMVPANAGQLNYCISYMIHQYLQKSGTKYSNINEVIGVLECAKLELYRQIAAPYEDIKKMENGSISKLDDKWWGKPI